MAFTVGQISADITADDKGFRTTINRVERRGKTAGKNLSASFDQIGRSMQRVGTVATVALTAPLVAGMKRAVNEAALLEGAFAKFDAVFKDQADEVRAWVDEFREGVPLARREIVQAAGSMQDLLVPMGIARTEATDMTKEWLQLAAALSAFNDVPMSQALDAIRSGMAGASEPLRRFGIDARVLALEQVALEEGLIQAGEAMNDQARLQALLIQATKQSADAVDGYADQLDSTLIRQQELEASAKDMLATYGADLKPMFDTLVRSATDVVKFFGELDDSQRSLVLGAAGLATAFGPVALGLGTLIRLLPKAIASFKALNATMLANPYVAVGAAILAIGGHAFLTTQRIKRLNEAVENALSGDISTKTLQDLNNVIAQTEERISEQKDLFKGLQIDPSSLESFRELQSELDRLIERRDQLAAQELDSLISERDTQNASDTANETNNVVAAINNLKPAVDNVKPLDEVFLPEELQRAREEMQLMNFTLADFQRMTEEFDFGDEMIKVGESTSEAASEMNNFGNVAVPIFDQLVFQGEKLDNILSSILRRLASSAFGSLIGGLIPGGSLLGGLFGGFRAEGGSVSPGKSFIVGEEGPELFTPSRSGTIIPNGGSVSAGGMSVSDMSKGFEMALDRKLQQLGPDEIFVLSQKGKFSF